VSLAVARNYPPDCAEPIADLDRRVFAKARLSERLYDLLVVPQARQSAGSSAGETTASDKVYDTTTGASFVTDYRVSVVPKAPDYTFSGGLQSTGNLAFTGTGGNFVGTFVSTGTERIVASDSRGQTTIIKVPVSQETGASAFAFLRYASGSLAAYLVSLLDRLASPPSINVFSTQTPSTQTYIRNQSCWVSDIDFTSKGVWNTAGGFGMGGCLLTPRHAVFTAHYGYHPSVNTQIHFVGRGAAAGQPEQVAVRTVSHVNAGISRDQCLIRLSEAVPEFITPAKVFPPDTFSGPTSPVWIPRERAQGQLALNSANITGDGDLCFAGVTIDKDNNARLRLPRVNNRIGWFHYSGTADYAEFLPYAQTGVPGDSGTPVYCVVDGEAVYLGNHTGIGSGTCLTRDEPQAIPGSALVEPAPLKEIRDQIAAWGDNDVIEAVDLSGFPTY